MMRLTGMYNKLKCYTHLTFCYRWLALFAVNTIFALVLVKALQNRLTEQQKKGKEIKLHIWMQFALNTCSTFFLLLPSCICLLIFSPLRCYRIDFTFISISVIELIFKEEKIIHETYTLNYQKGMETFFN